MKDVGFTNDGGKIVEMSREEYDQFVRLHYAVEGSGFPSWNSHDYSFQQGFDFTNTFEVIRAYYHNLFYVNQIQEFVDSIKKTMKG